MLSKSYRLKKKKEFQTLFTRGKSIANKYIVVYIFKRNTGNKPRIGFAVSKKLGTAVERNKIKRRLRAVVYSILPQINKEYDIIIVARGKIKGISFKDVEKNILVLFKNTGLIEDEKK